jgi:hypothetical protein
MNRIAALLAIAMMLFTTSACSAKKPPEQTTVRSKNVLAALRDMQSAYEKKSLSSFMDNVATGFKDREALSLAIAAVFLKNESIRFNIQYTKMIIVVEEKGPIKVSFNWDGEWHAVGGTTQKNSGRATLVFDPGSFKVVSIDGKDPFVPVPAEIPGKQ